MSPAGLFPALVAARPSAHDRFLGRAGAFQSGVASLVRFCSLCRWRQILKNATEAGARPRVSSGVPRSGLRSSLRSVLSSGWCAVSRSTPDHPLACVCPFAQRPLVKSRLPSLGVRGASHAPGARACGGLFRGARRPWLCFSAASSGRRVRCCRRLALSASGAAHGGLTTLVLLCGSYAARQMFPRECPLPVVKSPPLVTLFVGLSGSECGFPRTSSARVCSPSELRRVSRRQPPAGRRLLARAEPSVPPGGRGRPRALGEVAGPRGLSPATAPSAFRARCVPRVSSPRVSPAALGCRLSVALSSVSSRARARLWAFALWSRRGLRCVFHRRRSPSPPAPPPRRVLVTKRGGCSYFLLFFALKFSCCNCLTPYSEKAVILCFCLSP